MGAVIGLALLAITVVAAAITGAIEREKLRNAINEVYCNRIAVKLSVERQRAFNDWSASIIQIIFHLLFDLLYFLYNYY